MELNISSVFAYIRKHMQTVIILSYAVIQSVCIFIGVKISVRHYDFMYPLVLILIGAVGFILVYLLIKYVAKQARLEKTSQFLDEQITLQKRHAREMDIQYESIEKFKSDFMERIDEIKKINKEKDRTELLTSVTKLAQTIQNVEKISFTGDGIIDSVIYFKLNTAREYKIKMSVNTQPIKLNTISSIDVCSVIANLLDNAIEACEREGAERYVDLSIKKIHNDILIGTRNPCSSFNPLTTKKNAKEHGIGTLIINDIAEKYNGYVKRDLIGNEIYITVSLSEDREQR